MYTPGAGDIATGSVVLILTTNDPDGPCEAASDDVIITILPKPTVGVIANRVHCNGESGDAISFSGTATAFNWTASADVGFGTAGSGDIAAYTANNTGNSPVTATVTVTPQYTANNVTCTGDAITFTVTVNLQPTANAISNRIHCDGDAGLAIAFSGTATSFNWSSTGNVGFGTGANGVQGIGAYTAANPGNSPATVTVTPVYEANGKTCTGTPITFTVTVNPLPPCTITKNSPAGSPEAGQTATYSGPSGTYGYAWSLSANTAGASFVGGVNNAQNVSVVTTTTGVYTLTLVVTNTATGCISNPSCSQAVTVTPSAVRTSYTKGFWGTAGGAFCGGSGADKTAVLNFMYNAIGGSNAVFGIGPRKFTLMQNTCVNTGTATKPAARIWKLLPGGSTPGVLTCNGATSDRHVNWNCVVIDAVSTSSTYESIRNNLLAQGIAMFFNMKKDNTLGTAVLYGNKLTFTGTGACVTGSTTQTIPICVYNAAGAANGGTVTVQSIYNIAMRVLGTDPTLTGISAADANAALNALNVGFDKGTQITGVQFENSGCTAAPATRQVLEVVTEVKTEKVLTVTVSPNPYHDKLRFTVSVPEEGYGSLEVYNTLGQKVKVVYNGFMSAGIHNYEFAVPAAQRANVIYLFRQGNKLLTGKVIQATQ